MTSLLPKLFIECATTYYSNILDRSAVHRSIEYKTILILIGICFFFLLIHENVILVDLSLIKKTLFICIEMIYLYTYKL